MRPESQLKEFAGNLVVLFIRRVGQDRHRRFGTIAKECPERLLRLLARLSTHRVQPLLQQPPDAEANHGIRQPPRFRGGQQCRKDGCEQHESTQVRRSQVGCYALVEEDGKSRPMVFQQRQLDPTSNVSLSNLLRISSFRLILCLLPHKLPYAHRSL